MPGPNEALQQTGPQIKPTIPESVEKTGVSRIDENQVLSGVQSQLADLQVHSVGGPHTIPETNHETTTATVTPITMPAPEESVDKTATPWWKNMLHMRQQKQQEQKEELPHAA